MKTHERKHKYISLNTCNLIFKKSTKVKELKTGIQKYRNKWNKNLKVDSIAHL